MESEMRGHNAKQTFCEEARRLLVSASLGDKLPQERGDSVKTHLAACEPCCAFAELMNRTDELLSAALADARGWGAADEGETDAAPPDDVVAGIVEDVHGGASAAASREGFDAARAGPRASRPRYAPWKLLAAFAASLLLVCLFQGALLWRMSSAAAGPLGEDLYLREKPVLKRMERLGRETARFKGELARVRQQLDAAISEVARRARDADAYLAHGRRQACAARVVRAAYVPRNEARIRSDELPALMDVVQGTTLFSSGHYETASEFFSRAAEAFSDRQFRILTLFALGTSQKCAGEYEVSLGTYDRILRIVKSAEAAPLSPHGQQQPPGKRDSAYRAMAQHFKGWSLYCLAERDVGRKKHAEAQHKLEGAQDCYGRALAIVPTYAKVRFNLWKLEGLRARIFTATGQPERRKACLQKGKQELQRAEDDLQRQIKRNSRDAKAHFSLAMVHASREKDGPALKHLQEAVGLDGSLAFLLRSEHVFDRLASTGAYRKLIQRAGQFRDQITMQSLFTDAEFPALTEEPPGTGTGREQPERAPSTQKTSQPGTGTGSTGR